MRSTTLAAVCLLSASASAQLTTTVPISAIAATGNTGNFFPWGTAATGWPGIRIECIYDSSHFTAAPTPINTPILITNIKWRADDVGGTFAGGTYSAATLSLATAAVDYTAASTTWALNSGPDYTQVHNGPVTVLPSSGGAPGVPGPYIVDIPVVPPFLYDPNLGDLVVDANFVAGAWTGGTQTSLDVQPTNIQASRVYASSLYPNANGVDAAAPVIEVSYIPPSGSFATNTTLGAGCVSAFNSFYEHLLTATVAAPALTGNVLFLFPAGTGYQGVWGAGVAAGLFVPPVAATTLLTGDDQTVPYTPTIPLQTPYGPQATLQVHGNAVIGFGAGVLNFPGTLPWVPTSNGFLNSTIGGIYAWHDYNQAEAGSGPIVAEEVAGTLYITFNGVESYPGGVLNPSTMQFQLDLASGNVRIVWLSVDSNATSIDGSSHLVGVTAPGASLNPGSVSLATATLLTTTPEVLPLSQAATTRPITGTSWNLTTGNIPPTGVIGLEVFGLLDPGLNDLGFIGMPGCGLRASLDVLNAYAVTGTSHSYSLGIPNNPGLLGIDLFTTGAVFQVPPVNAFGVITSNGIKGHIGDV